MEKALCPASLADTLGLQRRDYWDELNPILKKWKSVNNSNCPECDRFIKVNMGHHIRLMHSTYVVFLEVSGYELLLVVHVGTQREGSH